MSMASFIKKRFLDKEICVSINNGDTETLITEEIWFVNREVVQGVVKEVEEGVIVLYIKDAGEVFINADEISYFHDPSLDIKKGLKTLFRKRIGQ